MPEKQKRTPQQLAARWLERSSQMYYTFKPRPDRPELYDQQTAFLESQHKGVTWLIGGNGSGTSTLGLMKAIRFMLSQQPPPRPATPFWIISNTYETVMDTCWVEKLIGRGILPSEEVNWNKIHWYREKQNWPFRVPLRPWPQPHNQRNYWVIDFKSYDQGRKNMQARSIGGFLFVEQFGYELLTEVLRGCRDYDYGGNKLCEFTPVDPALSAEVEELITNDKMPNDWEVYRCNTRCALEAGHVKKEWFESFFGSISDEMFDTRMTGAFASYEGLIYPSFNRLIHVLDDDKFPRVPTHGVIHKRSIDWGSGPEHPWCCIWAFKDATGSWYIYDEYMNKSQTAVIADHADVVRGRHFWNSQRSEYRDTYGDPSRPDLMREMARHGVPITPANNAVDPGIEIVRRHLRVNPATGRPKLFIHRQNCPNLIRQLQIYRWEQASHRGVNPRSARPKPLKLNDDLPDCTRYLLFTDHRGIAAEGGIEGQRRELQRRPHVRHKRH